MGVCFEKNKWLRYIFHRISHRTYIYQQLDKLCDPLENRVMACKDEWCDNLTSEKRVAFIVPFFFLKVGFNHLTVVFVDVWFVCVHVCLINYVK